MCIDPELSTKQHSKVAPYDLVAVASAVDVNWEELAARLAPVMFSIIKTEQIKAQYGNPFIQSRSMLEEWANALDKEATNGSLIRALLKMNRRRQANEIFGEDLVMYVETNG